MTEYFIPKPPAEVFRNNYEDPVLGIIRENKTNFLIEKITYDNGILVWYKDCPFPRRGFPTPEAVSAVNIVKHVFIEAIKTASMWQFTFAWFVSIFTVHERKRVNKGPTVIDYGEPRQSSVEKLLRSFNRITTQVVSKYILKPEYMTPLASELQGLLYAFMRRMGLSHDATHGFCTTFGAMIEYDNAYRYRLEDIFSETTKQKLMENPRKEISRLMKIYCSREKDWGVAMKFRTINRLTNILFLIPKVKNSFKKALRECEFKRLQLDEIDRFWVNSRLDYDFFGIPYAERMKNHVAVPGYQLSI